MRAHHLLLSAGFLVLLSAASTTASDRVPVAVAPGAAPGFGVVDTRCPTFHWTEVGDAAGYEIVVLRADGLRADGLPPHGGGLARGTERDVELIGNDSVSLRATLPAAATGWTPSLEQCLRDDAGYVWLIRARHERGWGEWSEPGLFQVRARREITDDESLLRRVVREILAEELGRGASPSDLAAAVSALGMTPQTQGSDATALAADRAINARDPRHVGTGTLRTEQSIIVASVGIKSNSTNTVAGSAGVHGQSTAASGFVHGVWGSSQSPDGPAIYGQNTAATSPLGFANGVRGDASAPNSIGVYGLNSAASGTGIGVRGDTHSTSGYGVYGFHNKNSGDGVGVFGRSGSAGGTGGYFVNTAGGNILIGSDGANVRFSVTPTGNVFADGSYNCGASLADGAGGLDEAEIEPCLKDDSPADFAEMLPAAKPGLEAGDVLALDSNGELVRSHSSYQTTVIGVVSTRPSYLGNSRFAGRDGYAPVALVGVVPVKVTDQNGPIRAGDLLVSSSRPGHAMRAGKNAPQGSVIGKALARLDGSVGVVTMVAMLQ